MISRFLRGGVIAASLCLVASPALAGVEDPSLAMFVYADAVAKGDAAALSTLYAEDAVVWTPGGNTLEGREAIRAANATTFAASTAQIEFSAIHSDMSDAKGVMRWNWTLTVTPKDGSGPGVINGRSMMAWTKGKDGWEISADVYQVLP